MTGRAAEQTAEQAEEPVSGRGWWSLTITGVDLEKGDPEWGRIGDLVAEGYTSGEIANPTPPLHWHVGSNIPGYLPHTDVRCFGDDADSAKDALLEELRVAQDALPDCDYPSEESDPACEHDDCGRCVGHTAIQAVLDEPGQIVLDLEPTNAGGFQVNVHDGRVLPVQYWITRVAGEHCDVDSEYV